MSAKIRAVGTKSGVGEIASRGLVSFHHRAILDLVEAAYDAQNGPAHWRDRVLHAGVRLVPDARSGTWFEYDWHFIPEGLAFDRCHHETVTGPDPARETWLAARQRIDPSILARLFGRNLAGTSSGATGARGGDPASIPQWRELWKAPVADSLGIVTASPEGTGACLSVGLPSLRRLSKREVALLTRIAVHLGAGHRLATAATASHPDRADAVLSPRGKLLHAENEAKQRRGALDDGWRRRTEARKSRDDADYAMTVWRGLIAGRWSLVDHFDTDGKRLVLAMRNAPSIEPMGALSEREKQVTALAAMGHRDKEIAYSLGLSSSAVAAALRRARAKLRASSRAALAAKWRRHG